MLLEESSQKMFVYLPSRRSMSVPSDSQRQESGGMPLTARFRHQVHSALEVFVTHRKRA